MNKFLINFRAEFDVTNNKLVGSYLRPSYNHVLLEKTSRLYQIRCLTCRNTAAILKIYFKNAIFLACHIPDRRDHVHKSDLTRSRPRVRRQEIWVRV